MKKMIFMTMILDFFKDKHTVDRRELIFSFSSIETHLFGRKKIGLVLPSLSFWIQLLGVRFPFKDLLSKKIKINL